MLDAALTALLPALRRRQDDRGRHRQGRRHLAGHALPPLRQPRGHLPGRADPRVRGDGALTPSVHLADIADPAERLVEGMLFAIGEIGRRPVHAVGVHHRLGRMGGDPGPARRARCAASARPASDRCWPRPATPGSIPDQHDRRPGRLDAAHPDLLRGDARAGRPRARTTSDASSTYAVPAGGRLAADLIGEPAGAGPPRSIRPARSLQVGQALAHALERDRRAVVAGQLDTLPGRSCRDRRWRSSR